MEISYSNLVTIDWTLNCVGPFVAYFVHYLTIIIQGKMSY